MGLVTQLARQGRSRSGLGDDYILVGNFYLSRKGFTLSKVVLLPQLLFQLPAGPTHLKFNPV